MCSENLRDDGPSACVQTLAAPKASTKKRFVVVCLRFTRDLLAFVGLLSLIYHIGFDLSVVVSGSMAPTLCGDGGSESDWVLTERVSYWFREPRRWEVVQFSTEDQMIVAKRVVGLPGETIGIVDKQPVIDSQIVPPPSSMAHLRYLPQGSLSTGQTQECGEGYYLLGDDSQDSWDSRFDGPIRRSAMRGRAWLIVWPPSRMGFVADGNG